LLQSELPFIYPSDVSQPLQSAYFYWLNCVGALNNLYSLSLYSDLHTFFIVQGLDHRGFFLLICLHFL
jgi:hypothetical protein